MIPTGLASKLNDRFQGHSSVVAGLCLLVFLHLNVVGCVGSSPKNTLEAGDSPDWKNISQFASVSAAGPDSIWVVTVQGELVKVSKSGEQRKVNDAGEVTVVGFIDSQHGWVVDRKSCTWSTTDGGSSWQRVSTPPERSDGFYLPKQLVFIDDIHGWLVCISKVWRTVDGGRSWRDRFAISSKTDKRIGRLYRGAFVGTESGWISSSGGVVIHTGDGGVTWNTLTPVSERTDLHDVFFADEHTGWLIGRPKGGIYSTEDEGATWRQQLTSVDRTYLNSVTFVNRSEGWAVGWRSTGLVEVREAIVLHTSDGGVNWVPNEVGERERFVDRVSFYDSAHGWLIARDRIYYTEDGGQSWRVVLTFPPIEK